MASGEDTVDLEQCVSIMPDYSHEAKALSNEIFVSFIS